MAGIKTLNNAQYINISSGSDTATNSTSITKLQSIGIDANTFTTNDFISFGCMFYRDLSSTSATNAFLYIGTGDTLTGAIQVGQYQIRATDGFCYLSRRLVIKNATGGGTSNNQGTQVIVTSSLVSDFVSTTTSSLAIDWTKTVYFISAGQCITGTDAIGSYGLRVFTY